MTGTHLTIHSDPGLTQLLNDWKEGNKAASDEALERIYGTLQDMSRRMLKGEMFATMATTDLVNEALTVFLVKSSPDSFEDRAHFFGIVSHLMRQILIQRARRRKAEKRGGSEPDLTLDDEGQGNTIYEGPAAIPLIDLDNALTALAEMNPRQAQVAEMLYFAGLTQAEAAEVLGVGTATIERDWRYAKIFLRSRLSK